MSDSEATSETDPEIRAGFGGLPRWLRIGIVAAAAAVAALIIAVVIRIILQTPVVPLGPQSADVLQPGSCLLEPGTEETYTVVNCTTPHQQQVVASVDLTFPGVTYSADDALATFAGLTCDRLLEYRLYLPQDIVKNDYVMSAVSPPTLEQYEAGDASTLCAIADNPDAPDEGGTSDDLTRDLYRPIPQ